MIAFCLPAMMTDAGAGSLIYKNYIVRYDRGWDILCEPYQVRQGDWVLKIFRQKGEIAHQDFREFLSVFQRLNPQIRDIDMIRPGQTVDIPLRKLEHGSLPGQATGVITIPFVSLTQVNEKIVQRSERYQVQWGDTVSSLIARHYGRFGSAAYKEGIQLFKAANPDITDMDRIYVGQTIYLPDPAMREETWYASIYDEKGDLREGLNTGSGTPPQANTDIAVSIGQNRAVAPLPESGRLQEAAAVVGGKFSDKGTRFVPRPGGEDFEIDLSHHPLLELENQVDLVFTQTDDVMGVDKTAVNGFWPAAKVVSYDSQASVEEIVSAIFNVLQVDGGDSHTQGAEVGFVDQGIRVKVQAKWIRPADDGRQVCIRPIDGPADQTPEALRRYLEQHGIILKELLPGGQPTKPPVHGDSRRHAVRDILDLAPKGQKEFVQNLAKGLGFSFSANIGITFPYAGVMVEAYTNLLSAGEGRELLVDFGDLYGDALDAIRRSGPAVVQITAVDGYDLIANKLMAGLGLTFNENPTFSAAAGSVPYDTFVMVAGLLLPRADNHSALLTGVQLPAAVAELIGAKGVSIIQW